MEIEKLMELQEEEKAKHSGEKASKVKIELEKEEIEDDITLIPSVLPVDDVENYIDLERINRILTLTDQHNDEVNSILRAHVLGKIDPTRFIVFEDKDLTKMLLQVMWEDEKIDLEAALGVVADLVGNHDREEAAMLIDEGVSLFVEEVIAKTEKGMYKKAQAIVLSSMDSKSESELLGGFLDRVLSSAGGEKALVGRQVSGELIRKYLAVNPVMTEVFAKIKENIIIGIPRKKENSTEKEELWRNILEWKRE